MGFHVVAQGPHDAGPQSQVVGAALGSGNAVDVAANPLVALFHPGHRHFHARVLIALQEKHLLVSGVALLVRDQSQQVAIDTLAVVENDGGLPSPRFDGNLDAMEIGLGFQTFEQNFGVEGAVGENFRIGPEVNAGAAAALFAQNLQGGLNLAPTV